MFNDSIFRALIRLVLFALFPVVLSGRTPPGIVLAQTAFVVLPGAITAAPVLLPQERDEPLVLIATEDRYLRTFATDGTEVRKVNLGFRATALFIDEDKSIIAVSSSGRVHRITPAGQTVQRLPSVFPGDRREEAAFSLDGAGNLRVRSSQRIDAFSPIGTPIWSTSFPAPIRSSVQVSGSEVYGLENGRLLRIDDGAIGSSITVIGTEISVLARAGDDSFVSGDTSGRISLINTAGVIAWSYDTGGVVRRIQTGDRFFAVIAPAGGATPDTILVLGSTGSLENTIVPAGGRIVFSAAVGNRIATLSDAGVLTVSDYSGIIAETRISGSPPVGMYATGENTLIVSHENWLLEFFRLDGERVTSRPDEALRDENRGTARGRAADPVPTGGSGPFVLTSDAILSEPGVVGRNRLLATIEERITSAALFGSLDSVRSVLVTLAQEVYRDPIYSGSAVVNDYPAIRMAAVTLLGKILDSPSRRALATVATRDPDHAVAAAAFTALGAYGFDPESRLAESALRRFSEADTAGKRTLSESVARIAALPGAGTTGLELLNALTRAPIPRDLRERAMRLYRATGTHR